MKKKGIKSRITFFRRKGLLSDFLLKKQHLLDPKREEDKTETMAAPQTHTATCSAPVNIAVIKYWGKRDTSLILPTNDSLSVTLDQDHLRSVTTASASAAFEAGDRLWLNGVEEQINDSKRLLACIKECRKVRKAREETDSSLAKVCSPLPASHSFPISKVISQKKQRGSMLTD